MQKSDENEHSITLNDTQYLNSQTYINNDCININYTQSSSGTTTKKFITNKHTNPKLQSLKNWGLPDSILLKYEERGIKKMFEWQVECLANSKVLQNRNNLVYSAPTSAGKTLVAEILALKTLLELGKKVLIILPFVSVVREKMFYFQDILSTSGIRVEGFMGSHSPPGGFKMVQLAICTIEKANSIINRLLEDGSLDEIGAVIIDEMHLLGDANRGYLLELLLTKLRYMSTRNNLMIQLIGMSATLPNLEILSKWLDAELYTTTFRPIPLNEYYSISNEIYDVNLEICRKLCSIPELCEDTDNILQLCLETIKESCSVLIFCPTKNWCENLSQQISTAFRKLGRTNSLYGKCLRDQLNSNLISEILEQLKRCPVGLDSVLKKSVSFGTAYHHAGLTMDERDIIESAFRTGGLRVLVATSTLSSGVNLPAQRVIVRTPIFHGKPVDSLIYRQMIGRAGRMGRDILGESILICQKTDRRIAEELMTADLRPIESCLEGAGRLKRAILEVVASGVATSPLDIQLFSNCTLLAVSQQENTQLQDPIQHSLEFLIRNEFIRLQKNDLNEDVYVATNLAKACLTSSLPPEDGLALFEEIEKARQCFVLDSDLHILYLVTPYSVCNQWINLDWMIYLEIWERLTPRMRRVAELVGVQESFIFNATRGHSNSSSKQYHKLQIHRRFYTALALQDLVNEIPLNEVAKKYQCNRGMLQSLQQSASMFAGMVTSFCAQLGWKNVEIIVSQFQDRLQFGIQYDLLDLMKLPNLNGQRARAIFNAGVTCLADLASLDLCTLENILLASVPFESEKERDGESAYDVEQKRKVRGIFITGKQGLTARDAADMLIKDARRYLQLEIGGAVLKWEEKIEEIKSQSSTSVEMKRTNLCNTSVNSRESVNNINDKSTYSNYKNTSNKLNCETEILNIKNDESASITKNEVENELNGEAEILTNHNESKINSTNISKNEEPLILDDFQQLENKLNGEAEILNKQNDSKINEINSINEESLILDDSQQLENDQNNSKISEISSINEELLILDDSQQLENDQNNSKIGEINSINEDSLILDDSQQLENELNSGIGVLNKQNEESLILNDSQQFENNNSGIENKQNDSKNEESLILDNSQQFENKLNSGIGKNSILENFFQNLSDLNELKNISKNEFENIDNNNSKTELFEDDFMLTANFNSLELNENNIKESSNTSSNLSDKSDKSHYSFTLQISDSSADLNNCADFNWTPFDISENVKNSSKNEESDSSLFGESICMTSKLNNVLDDISITKSEDIFEEIEENVVETSQTDITESSILSCNSLRKNKTPRKRTKHQQLSDTPKKQKIEVNDFTNINIVDVCENKELFDMFCEDITQQPIISLSCACEKIHTDKPIIGQNILQPSTSTNSITKNEQIIDDRLITGFAVSFGQNVVYFVSFSNQNHVTNNRKIQTLRNILLKKTILLRIFDYKEHAKLLYKFCKIVIDAQIQDPKIVDWLLEPEGKEKQFSSMVVKYFPELVDIAQLAGNCKGLGSIALDLNSSIFGRIRASVEAITTWHLMETLAKTLDAQLLETFKIEMKSLSCLAYMEVTGIKIDKQKLNFLITTIQEQMAVLQQQAFSLVGRRFSFTSPKEVAKILGLQSKRKPSTNKQTLEQSTNPLANVILQWRKLNCTLTKMVFPIIRALKNDRIHGCCVVHSATGRISMHEPNLQNIPRNFDVIKMDKTVLALSARASFIPSDGKIFLSADYCQLELRILAHLSQDTVLCKIMRKDGDVFKMIAARLNRIRESQVTDTLRQRAKQLCYGIIYGMGNKALAEQLNSTEEEATEFSNSFKITYPKIQTYIQDTIKNCQQNGYVTTLAGRKRYLPLIKDDNIAIKNQAERQAVNTTIQGSAADIAKKAMTLIDDQLRTFYSNNLGTLLVLHLHDELLYEVPYDDLGAISQILKGTMENSVKLSIPFPVKLRTGCSWGELEEFTL